MKLNPFYRIQRKKQVRKKLEENALRRADRIALQQPWKELSEKEIIRFYALLHRFTDNGMEYSQAVGKAFQMSTHFERQQRSKELNQSRGRKKNSPYKLTGIRKKDNE